MKHFFALPALLRPALLLAAASQHAFSVNDDLLAFPQYEIRFTDDFVTEEQAISKLQNILPETTDDRSDHDREADTSNSNDALDHYQPSPSSHSSSSSSGHDGDSSHKPPASSSYPLLYENLVLQDQRYICSIPQVPPPNLSSSSSEQNDTLSRAEQAKELARATDRGWELVQGMRGNCVYFVSGWWSYRFCYGEGIKQFHQLPPSRGVPNYPPVEDPTVDGFWLGKYEKGGAGKVAEGRGEDAAVAEEKESGLDVGERGLDKKGTKAANMGGELVQRGESRYLVQRLEGGTTCDLTGKDRKVEIQFHCNPQSTDRISLIKETSTCAYLLVVQTPRLCSDVAFLPPQKDAPNSILCSPVLHPDDVASYESNLAVLKSAEADAAAGATFDPPRLLGDPTAAEAYDPPLQVVGDIAVGGHALIPPGKKIEKTAIVGGGKETYVDTLASSDGKVLSEEEIKKLGLGDPKAVAKLRKDLEKIAKGQQWKLDVIDTPRGREYRGIIGDEEDEVESGKKEGDISGEEDGKKGKGAGKSGKDRKEDEEEGSQEEYFKEEL